MIYSWRLMIESGGSVERRDNAIVFQDCYRTPLVYLSADCWKQVKRTLAVANKNRGICCSVNGMSFLASAKAVSVVVGGSQLEIRHKDLKEIIKQIDLLWEDPA